MFTSTIIRKHETGDTITIVTPFGISTGKVIEVDENSGTFVFQSKQVKPFKLYMGDVLLLSEVGGFV